MMSGSKSPARFRALVRRGAFAGLLLPGLLLLNLVCFCVHGSASAAADPASQPAAHCRSHEKATTADAGGAPDSRSHQSAACPHCGEGSALHASPRIASDSSLTLLDMAGVFWIAFTVSSVREAPLLNEYATQHSPPSSIARNRILRI
jgi:hypothetical protein